MAEEQIKRQMTRYFIVRYPTGSSAEVLTKTGIWLSPFNDESMFWRSSDYGYAQAKARRNEGKVISLADLENLRTTLNRIRKLASED